MPVAVDRGASFGGLTRTELVQLELELQMIAASPRRPDEVRSHVAGRLLIALNGLALIVWGYNAVVVLRGLSG